MLQFPNIEKPHIFIIGAGGTGGFTFTNLARLLAGSDTPITLYDGDIVESKNLKRQQFGYEDITKNKASALQTWANDTLPEAPQITTHETYIIDSDEFLADLYVELEDGETPIIISAVDNVATRKLINKALLDYDEEYIAIDSGNNNQGGQVVITSHKQVIEKHNPFDSGILVSLANMFDVYPHLNDINDENPGLHTSCDDVVESEPQAMMANSRNGDIIANIVMNLIIGKHLAGNVYVSNLEDFTTKVSTVTL